MAKKYTLHYLNDKEFDNLPYKHVRTSLGCADEKTGNAYVRRTGIKPIDEFTTDHEISELIAKVSPHEEDGIRYKNLWKQLVAALPGGEEDVSKVTSSGGSGIYDAGGPTGTGSSGITPTTTSDQLAKSNPVTGSLGANTNNTSTINQPTSGSGLTNAFNDYQSNQLGFASVPVSLGGTTSSTGTTGSNLSTINNPTSTNQNSWSSPNSIANMFTTSQASNSNLGSNVSLGNQNYDVTGGSQGLTASPATNTSSASSLGFETPSTTTKANVPLQTINQAAVSPSLQTGGETSTNTQAKTATKTPFLESIFGKDWRQNLLGQAVGAGISAIGQATAGKTQTVNPTDSALYNQVVERVQSGTQVELTPAQTLAITQNYDTQLEQARKNIIEKFKALRPGSDISNDSQLQQALIELENDFAEQKATAITAAQLNLTQTQTAQLSELAALDINSLATNAGISNQEAADFKAMMASLGAMVANGGGQQRVYA
jgi:hypothetical protein